MEKQEKELAVFGIFPYTFSVEVSYQKVHLLIAVFLRNVSYLIIGARISAPTDWRSPVLLRSKKSK